MEISEEKISQIEKRLDKLENRNSELESQLNDVSTFASKVKESVEVLAGNQTDTAEKLNTALDEIRNIGGKLLPKAETTVPEKVERAMTLLELD